MAHKYFHIKVKQIPPAFGGVWPREPKVGASVDCASAPNVGLLPPANLNIIKYKTYYQRY